MSSISCNGDSAIRRSSELDPAPILDVLPEELLQTPDEAFTALDSLYKVLPRTGYVQLIPFAHIYSTLTGRVVRAINEGRFNDPQSASLAVPNFLQKFSGPVRSHLQGDEVGAREWATSMDPRLVRAHPVLAFERDMTTHIDVDLEETCAELGVPETYRVDYDELVDDLIRGTAQDLADIYLPYRAAVQRHVVNRTVNRIARMRAAAWWKGEQLAPYVDDPEQYAKVREGLPHLGPVNRWMYRYPGNWALCALDIVVPAGPIAPTPPEESEFQQAA